MDTMGKYMFMIRTPFSIIFVVRLDTRHLGVEIDLRRVHHQYLMEACLWSFYGGWIFELQWGPSMVIFHHGDAAEDKGEEVRGGTIHLGISHGRRSFTTKRMPWIRSLERVLQWRKRKRERKRKGGARNWRKKRGREVKLWSLSHKTLIHQSYHKCYTCFYL